jgi:hypothetical protein
MTQCKWIACCLLIALFFNSSASQSQTFVQAKSDARIDSRTRAAVVAEIGDLLIEKYIFLDVAEKIKKHIDTRLKNGDYDGLDDPVRFCSALVEDLYEVSQDKHFHIEFNPQLADLVRAQQSESEEEKERAFQAHRENDRQNNFGFRKVENLTGNIGYVDIRYLSNAEYAGQTAVAAMNFVANCDAVIIDVRDTPGGFPNMVQLLCSYFVKGVRESRTHLNTFERRFDDSIEQFWTWSYVPGPRMYDLDLYVLTSQFTGSGAEELAYNLRNLKRATLVGESTGGAAHPVKDVVVQRDFVMHLPEGRPINPISGTNWEGTGVEPHVAVPADLAFDAAYKMALEKRLAEAGDQDQRFGITWALDGLRAKLEPFEVDEATLRKYAGTYGERKVWLEDGALHYQRSGPVFRLIPIKERFFALEGLDRFRAEFVMDGSGQAKELVGHYDNGMTDSSARTE